MDENKKMMTPEEKDSLKEEIMKAVEDQLAIDADMSREEAIGAVVKSLEALEGEPEMGGMGEEAEAGMKVPGEEDGPEE